MPGSRTLFERGVVGSSTQLPDADVTSTVVDLPLSRLVTFRRVPAGNWLLDAAARRPSPESVTVDPAHTTSPAPPPPPPAGARPALGGAACSGGAPCAGGCPPWAPPPTSHPLAACFRLISSMTASRLAIRASDCASGLAR